MIPVARLSLLVLFAVITTVRAADITVQVTRSGDTLQVDANAEFDGTAARAWQVMTDYSRFSDFIPGLRTSRIVSRQGNLALVEQQGEARFLFVSFPINVRLAITERPQVSIESRVLSGNFREMRCTYRLEQARGRMRLRYSGQMVPDFYVPPFIGTLVLRHNIETTFRALVDEIERQHRGADAPR